MKTFFKLVIGIILLWIGFTLASQAGRNMAGGSSSGSSKGWDGTIPLGTIQISVDVNGK